MIMDRTGLFSDQQAIVASAASTNIVDLGATGTQYGAASAMVRDIGPGRVIPLIVTVTESFTLLTSLRIDIQVDDNSDFTSAKTVFQSPAYTLAQLAAGAKENLLPDSIPLGTDERYMRLYYTVAGSNPDAGKITAGVVMARQTNK